MTTTELVRVIQELQDVLGLGADAPLEDFLRAVVRRVAIPEVLLLPVQPSFIAITPGTFTMGSPPDESGRYLDETQHQVMLTRGFYMQSTQVTQGQYQALMDDNPSYFKGADLPVEQVSWFDAVAYANALSAKEGLAPAYLIDGKTVTLTGSDGYRLPTEAEWEYACRAGTTGARYGDLDAIAWHSGNSDRTTHPVGQKQPNAWGLYDMIGNVWEWCWDWYGAYSGDATDPLGPATGSSRVDRGGSWFYDAQDARAASRSSFTPDYRNDYLGFRLVRSVSLDP